MTFHRLMIAQPNHSTHRWKYDDAGMREYERVWGWVWWQRTYRDGSYYGDKLIKKDSK